MNDSLRKCFPLRWSDKHPRRIDDSHGNLFCVVAHYLTWKEMRDFIDMLNKTAGCHEPRIREDEPHSHIRLL